jgi:AmpD protein
VPYANDQYLMLGRIARALARRYPIAEIVGHSDVAPGRKTDPGAAFDWTRLAGSLRGHPKVNHAGARSAV